MTDFQAIKRLLSLVRQADEKYHMIDDGDRIAVGLSGGKDSIALLCALRNLQLFYPKRFSLCAISIDMGLSGMDYVPLAAFCKKEEIPFEKVATQIAQIVFEERKEQNPCSLCSRMRRGALLHAAVQLNCTKLALGHHFDDAVDTFMLNLFYEGRLGSFSPVTVLEDRSLQVIRPLILTQEKVITSFLRQNNLPVLHNKCPADKNTKREEMKQLLLSLERKNKGLRHRIFHAMCKADIDGYGGILKDKSGE